MQLPSAPCRSAAAGVVASDSSKNVRQDLNMRPCIGSSHDLCPPQQLLLVDVTRGADKSLARPGRKQANACVRMA